MNYLGPIGKFLWDNFDLILFGFLALLALEELNSGFSMIEIARTSRKAKPRAGDGPPQAPGGEAAAPGHGDSALAVTPAREWAK